MPKPTRSRPARRPRSGGYAELAERWRASRQEPAPCGSCHGRGTVQLIIVTADAPSNEVRVIACKACHGSGRAS